MRKSPRILLATLACALLAGIAWLALREEEPHYQGKPLSYWLQAYDEANLFRFDRESLLRDGFALKPARNAYLDLEAAMNAAGTNSLPTLLRHLRANDFAWSQRFRKLVSKQKLVPVQYHPAQSLVYRGEVGIGFLGSRAAGAIPELMNIYAANPSPYVRSAVLSLLETFGPEAECAVPFLLRTYREDPLYRAGVLDALGAIHARPEITIPFLIEALATKKNGTPDILICPCALAALGKFGPDAAPGVPAIRRLMDDPTGPPLLYEVCAMTLNQILGPSPAPSP